MNNAFHYVRAADLIESATANGSFTTLCKALDAADMTHTLKGSGPYTIFAPTDEAFDKLPAGTLENWLKPENKAELVSVLKYHVLPGRTFADDVADLGNPRMMEGLKTKIALEGDKYTIDGAHFVGDEIISGNGVIHAIDAVILPVKSERTTRGRRE